MEVIEGGSATDAALRPVTASLADSAGSVAAHARPLLVASHAVLLSLTITTRAERCSPVAHPVVHPIAMCWAGFPQPVLLRATLVPFTKSLACSLAAFEDEGQRLLRNLMARWPANAVPPAMGIVTDGGGVIFSSDHPSPLRPDWLALHQAGICAPTALLPFSGTGAWARLTAAIAPRLLH